MCACIFQIHKIIGFAPTLLQVVMTNEIDMPVRQAGKYLFTTLLCYIELTIKHVTIGYDVFVLFLGVIYLKNLITSNWADREADNGPVEFSIHEQDRAMIRDAIVDAVVHAPELIRQVTL